MNVYIWNRLENVTKNWHTEGGLVVIAESLDHARQLLVKEISDSKDYGFPSDSDAFTTEPTHVMAVFQTIEPKVITFPDAGCC